MNGPIRDDNLRLLHAKTETTYIKKKLVQSAVATAIGLALGILLLIAFSHITRWSLDLAWLIPISIAPVGIIVFGLHGIYHYRTMQIEHQAFLKKYNRL